MSIWYGFLFIMVCFFGAVIIDAFRVETDAQKFNRCYSEWLSVNGYKPTPMNKEYFSKIYIDIL